jgi:protein associated with RNAse G/E
MNTSDDSPDAFRGAGRRIRVQKKNPAGVVTWEYEGVLLKREDHSITIEALFDREDMPFMGVTLKTGDRFVEHYYTDRWYNIFIIHDRDLQTLKGWYCNIGMPAVVEGDLISYVDLALDLWVSSDGNMTVLDEDEFEALALPPELKAGALRGLDELKTLFSNEKPTV